jgi:hypothetical protein
MTKVTGVEAIALQSSVLMTGPTLMIAGSEPDTGDVVRSRNTATHDREVHPRWQT